MKTPAAIPGRPPGFTLIELMVVIAVVALTVTMGFPSFARALRREGMRKVETGLIEACQSARRNAIMQNRITVLDFRPQDRVFSVPGVKDFDPVTIPPNVSIDILGVNFIELQDAEDAQVHFLPNGTSDEFTVLLHDPNGIYVKIYLDTVTALPEIENVNR